ncbi:hypothetical protein SAMN04489712_11937 [Thermomonospora echinospora]|uniref:Uncharacterized protein n=1 Tax=Thermomonospora echinospora TaxID=1992 RepID=A0A1H6DNJ8_9ACTN|nr:hypothetical protein SAMN04489712_11937 [Thermomonospora echinospora]
MSSPVAGHRLSILSEGRAERPMPAGNTGGAAAAERFSGPTATGRRVVHR